MADAEEVSYELSHQYLQPDMPPTKYRELLLTGLKNIEECILKAVHEIFQSGKYKGKRVVEVGCGPTIHRLATPSKYYNEIITSDYAPKNIESVKKWVDGDPDALDWTPLLEIVAASEGYRDIPSGVREIETRIRQKVKSVIRCDVLKESVFDSKIEQVDLLITSGCLEGACPNRESFATSLKNLASYVKSGGHIMLFTALGMSSASFDGKDFKVLDVDEDFVHRALEGAGFVLENRFLRENDIYFADFQGFLFVVARKL